MYICRGSDDESSASEDDGVALIGAGEPDGTDSDVGSPGAVQRRSSRRSGPLTNGHRGDGSDTSSDESGGQGSEQRRSQPPAGAAGSSDDEDSDDVAADDAAAAVARMMAAAAGGTAFGMSAQPASPGKTRAAAESPEGLADQMRQPSPEAGNKFANGCDRHGDAAWTSCTAQAALQNRPCGQKMQCCLLQSHHRCSCEACSP